MNKEAWKVFFACALGAGIGTLVALEMSLYLWWVGLLAGGLVGYLAYQPLKIIRAIPSAARAAARKLGLSIDHVIKKITAPYFLGSIAYTILAFVCMLSWFAGIIWVKYLWSESYPHPFIVTMIVIFLALIFAVIAVSLPVSDSRAEYRKNLRDTFRFMSIHSFPPIVLGYHLPRGIWWLMRHGLSRATVATVKFGWIAIRLWAHFIRLLFLKIHSELRLLCLVDATIGAAVGFFAGSVIIGALAGGVWGLINYAVITKRILEPRGYLPLDPS